MCISYTASFDFTFLKPPIHFDSMRRDRCGTRFTTIPLLRFYAEGVPAVHSADQEALRRLHVRIKGRKLGVDFLINNINNRHPTSPLQLFPFYIGMGASL